MENTTGVIFGKIGFYLALAALIVVLIIKKRKQVKNSHKNYNEDQENNKP